MSKFLEKAVTRIPSHSFPKVEILVSQKFLLIFSNFQKNADVSNLKKNFLFIIFMTYKIL